MIIKYNNKVVTHNDKWIGYSGEPTPTLPPYTLRLKYKDGVTPTFSKGTATQVSSSPNIWDLTYNNSDWTNLLFQHTDLLEVIDGNTSGVTNMEFMLSSCTSLTTVPLFDTSSVIYISQMFAGCTSLTSVPLFDTSNVHDMTFMFQYCTSLTTVPLFDTSNVTSIGGMFQNCTSLTTVPLFNTSNVNMMDTMFAGCTNVQSGALALYQQASSQANPPSDHWHTFSNCGSNTTTGSAELAQIPRDWK